MPCSLCPIRLATSLQATAQRLTDKEGPCPRICATSDERLESRQSSLHMTTLAELPAVFDMLSRWTWSYMTKSGNVVILHSGLAREGHTGESFSQLLYYLLQWSRRCEDSANPAGVSIGLSSPKWRAQQIVRGHSLVASCSWDFLQPIDPLEWLPNCKEEGRNIGKLSIFGGSCRI